MPELPPIHFLTGFDKSELLESLLNFGLRITCVVLPDSEKYLKLSRNVFELATKHQIQTVRVSASDWSNLAKVSATDSILLSARFPLKIPRQIFNCYLHALNIHPTLLPKYRGRYLEPILIAGDTESGVTLHLIDDDYDTGAIVYQMRFPVGSFDTVNTLLRNASVLEPSLVLTGIQLLLDTSFRPTPQNPDQESSFFEKRTPDDSYIPSSTPLIEALKTVRASNVVTHPAFTLIDGQKVIIEMRRPDKPTSEFDCI